MNHKPRRVQFSVISLCAGLACAGCAFQLRQEPQAPSRMVLSSAHASRVQQVDYGIQARFATCTGVDCAQPTPKTLSSEPVATSAPVALPSVVGQAAAPVAVNKDRDVDLTLPKPSAATVATSGDVSPPTSAADQWKVTLPMPTRAGDASSGARAQGTTLLAAADRRAVTLDERPPAASEPKVVPPSNGAGSPIADPLESRIVINFAFAGVKLTTEAKAAIREALPRVRSAERVVIAGRTDSVGDTSANQAIALARAISVKDYIAEVAPDIAGSIAIDARGNCCFVASNSTQDGRFKNRRVEIVMRGRVDA